jgi:hypothetical protein
MTIYILPQSRESQRSEPLLSRVLQRLLSGTPSTSRCASLKNQVRMRAKVETSSTDSQTKQLGYGPGIGSLFGGMGFLELTRIV